MVGTVVCVPGPSAGSPLALGIAQPCCFVHLRPVGVVCLTVD